MINIKKGCTLKIHNEYEIIEIALNEMGMKYKEMLHKANKENDGSLKSNEDLSIYNELINGVLLANNFIHKNKQKILSMID